MKTITVKKAVGALLIFGLLFSFIAGCTKYASEEDLKQLEMQQQAALSAEQKRDNLLKEKQELEAQLAAKQKELNTVQTEKKTVEKRLEEKKVKDQGGGQ